VFEGGTVKNSLWIHNQQPIVAKSTIFENCSIVSNYVGGIVMALAGEKATFKNCVIAGNKNYYQDISVSSYGGASFNYRNGWKNGAASSLTLINCYIEGADKISVYQYAGTGVDKAVYPSGSTAPILAFDTTGASDRIFERARQAGPGFVDVANGDWQTLHTAKLCEGDQIGTLHTLCCRVGWCLSHAHGARHRGDDGNMGSTLCAIVGRALNIVNEVVDDAYHTLAVGLHGA
jgi:hypothetical protein